MSLTTASKHCASKFCSHKATATSQISELSFCEQHINSEMNRFEKRKADLFPRLDSISAQSERQSLRLEQQALIVEMQEVADMFDAAQETLQQWRDKMMSGVQAVHDAVAERLRDASHADECSKDLAENDKDKPDRDLVELVVSVESWLDEANERTEKFRHDRSELRERQNRQRKGQAPGGDLRSVGDVAAGVQQLQFLIDRHLSGVMRQCWLENRDEETTGSGTGPVCQFSTAISELPSMPRYLALCNNTRGFAARSGRVIRADSTSEGCEPLPSVCIIIAFEVKFRSLMISSMDGNTRLSCMSELDWSSTIFGLKCDNALQQMYVAQAEAVSAIDLSGQVLRIISRPDLCESAGTICSIDFNSDKIFVLTKKPLGAFAIKKTSFCVESVIDLALFSALSVRNISLQGSKALFSEKKRGKLLRTCLITGQLLLSYPVNSTDKFLCPAQVSFNNEGVMFFSEYMRHSIRILMQDGTSVQTLGTPGVAGCSEVSFRNPIGVIFCSQALPQQLIVADRGNKRLCIFNMIA